MTLPFIEFIITLALVTLGSICGLLGGFILLWRESAARKLAQGLISFAAGVLLAAVFFDLLPEAIESGGEFAFLLVLIGILLFSITERALIFHFHHPAHAKAKIHEMLITRKASGFLLMLGDTIHNFLDGVVIAATTLINLPLGVLTAIAVFLHEIPQEIGDFSVLLYAKFPKRKIISYNILSSLAAFVGAVVVFFSFETIHFNLGLLAGLAAGNFLYIACSDLIPELKHETQNIRDLTIQTTILLIGVLVMWLLGKFLGI
ncbi:MAG: ZIP family metal transporter [Candidatus Nanoarchaeia archaeon]